MEQGGIRVRTARNEDYPAIQRIANAAPDSGAVQFNREHHVLGAYGPDGVNDQVLTVVAEATDKPGLLGSAKLSLGECRFAGAWTRYGLLGALAVHPAHRRRGVATALARHRIQLATESAGEDVLVLANIQAGNEASTAAARWWATGSAGQMTVIPVPMRRRPPRGRPDLLIRPAEEADLEQIAAALLGRGYDLGHRWDPERLRSWLAASPLPQPVNHYLVATDRSGRLLAGLGLREEGRLQSLVVRHAPLSIRLANRVLHVIPPDGRLRNVVADKVWFAPGHLDDARHLWQAVRWEWRERGSTVFTNHDPRGPVHAVVNTPWWLPSAKATVLVRSRRPANPDTIIDPML
ncbi:hypothetical protein GCM10022251_78780 [Phytohabitans flavus]|uniref:GNAT family N-acetyltransferase n=1 Tax=Phytohabitans flavus TaxID=1076124 RepID=UPI0031E5D558